MISFPFFLNSRQTQFDLDKLQTAASHNSGTLHGHGVKGEQKQNKPKP